MSLKVALCFITKLSNWIFSYHSTALLIRSVLWPLFLSNGTLCRNSFNINVTFFEWIFTNQVYAPSNANCPAIFHSLIPRANFVCHLPALLFLLKLPLNPVASSLPSPQHPLSATSHECLRALRETRFSMLPLLLLLFLFLLLLLDCC